MTMAIHEFDQGDFSVANNIPEDLAQSLNSMGILEDYIAMLDNIINDRTQGGADAYKQYTAFLTKMRSTDPIPAGFDASIQKRNQMIADLLSFLFLTLLLMIQSPPHGSKKMSKVSDRLSSLVRMFLFL